MADLDLSPRATPEQPARRRSGRRWFPIVVLALVIVAGGVIVTQFLTSAVDYYCNVDEIGTRDGCSPDRRIRLQGTVDEGSVTQVGNATAFTISFNGASMPVLSIAARCCGCCPHYCRRRRVAKTGAPVRSTHTGSRRLAREGRVCRL